MDYGHTNQQGFFTEGVGNVDPSINPDLADSLMDEALREPSSQALGNTALNAGNIATTNIDTLETTPHAQTYNYPMPPQLGQVLISPDSMPTYPSTAETTAKQSSLIDERGEIIASEVNSAANNPSSFYKTILDSRSQVNGGRR